MIRKLFALHVGLLLLCLGHLGCAVSGGNEAAACPLELRLSATPTEILQNEPAVLEVVLTNLSQKNQLVVSELDPALGALAYKIIGPDGKQHHYQPMAHWGGSVQMQQLAPHESLRHHQLLLYSPNWGIHFNKVGCYRIQAVFHAAPPGESNMVLESNEVTLIVRAAGGIDAEALEHFRGNPQARFVLGNSTAWAIGAEFETILRKYPTSSYAPWCYYCLARAWQRRREVPDDVKANKAIALYEKLLQQWPQFALRVEVRYQMAREMLRLGKKNQALQRIAELVQQHPDLHLLQIAKYQIESYREADLEIPIGALPE